MPTSAAVQTRKQIVAKRDALKSLFALTDAERILQNERREELATLNALYYRQVARSFVTLALAKCNEQGMEWWAVVAAGDGEELLENTADTTVEDLVKWLVQCESGDLQLKNDHTGDQMFFAFVWQGCDPDELLADFGWSEGSEELANEFATAFYAKHLMN